MAWQATMRRMFSFLGGAEERPTDPAPAEARAVREQLMLGGQEPPLTQEDWYWGRMTAGTEEDFFWRRLSDNCTDFTTICELKVSDNLMLAQATAAMVGALGSAKEQGWVSDDTAMRLLFQFAGEEVDIHPEREKIKG